jgi:hypothetical protein
MVRGGRQEAQHGVDHQQVEGLVGQVEQGVDEAPPALRGRVEAERPVVLELGTEIERRLAQGLQGGVLLPGDDGPAGAQRPPQQPDPLSRRSSSRLSRVGTQGGAVYYQQRS